MRLVNHTYSDEAELQAFIARERIDAAASVLVQLLFSRSDDATLQQVSDALRRRLPAARMMATSTAGVIGNGRMIDDTVQLSFTLFEASEVKVTGWEGKSVAEVVEAIGRELVSEQTKLLILFADTFRFDATSLIAGLGRSYPQIALAGGNAGDDYRFEGCRVFTGENPSCDIVAAAVDSRSLQIKTRYLLNWQSIGQEMTVTRSEGIELFEINGRSALSVYEHYLGKEVAGNILEYGIEFPLIFESGDVEVARAPVGFDPHSGSISFAGNVPEGVAVRFGYANVEHIDHNNKALLQKEFTHRHEAIYVYSCGSRRHMLGTFLNDELSYIDQIAPTAGFITYGEFFHDMKHCSNNLLNITTTFVVMDENPPSVPLRFVDRDLPKDKSEVTLKALTTLIGTTSEELEENISYLKQFKNAVNEASIFSIADKEGIITEANSNFETISGYTRDELVGQPHNIVRHADVSPEVFAEMWETIQDGRIWKGMIKNRRKDGRAYYVISEIVPIYNKDGSFREYIAIRNDVTELEEYKQLLKHELDVTSLNLEENLHYMRQYEDAINSTTAVLKTDTDNIITYANEKFCELSGHGLEELVGRNCEELRHEKHRLSKICVEIREELARRHSVRRVMTNVAKDGREYVLNNLFYPVLDLQGNVVEYLQVMHDITEIINLNDEIVNTQKEVVLTMGAIGETRSKETGLHVRRVAEYSYLLATLAGLGEEEASLLKQASPMHDIGKVGIPDSILNKPGKLTPEEFEVMKSHAEIGYEMLKHSERAILKASAVVAYTHHEKWDGSGYPRQLGGGEIPIYGRITAIADVFDALGHDRVYKKAWPLDKILELFKEERGRHFDPDLVDLFFEHLERFLEIRDALQDGAHG